MNDWFYNFMGKVQFGFASLVGVIGSCVLALGFLGGIGILLFHGGHWLVEGETVSILINDILPTPQHLNAFKGVQKIIDWIFELPLFLGLIIFGTAIGYFLIWLCDEITKDSKENM